MGRGCFYFYLFRTFLRLNCLTKLNKTCTKSCRSESRCAHQSVSLTFQTQRGIQITNLRVNRLLLIYWNPGLATVPETKCLNHSLRYKLATHLNIRFVEIGSEVEAGNRLTGRCVEFCCVRILPCLTSYTDSNKYNTNKYSKDSMCQYLVPFIELTLPLIYSFSFLFSKHFVLDLLGLYESNR